MRNPIGCLVVACALLSAGPAWARTEPYTIETVLKLEQIGRSAFDPTGRLVVFERYRPYDQSEGFDHGYYTRYTRSELMLGDAAHDGPATRLLSEREGVGHVLGTWSPNGKRLLIFRFRDKTWQAGLYSVASHEVVWLSVTPELPIYGPIAAWRNDDELIIATRPDGDLPWHLRMNWEPNVIQSTLTRRQAVGQPSAIVIGSGRFRNATPLREAGDLVMIDAHTADARRLAEGRFQDIELSIDGRYAAVAGEGGVLPVDPSRPFLQGELQRARSLRVIDLETGADWEPAPGWDLLPNLLTWSPSGELLVWMRPTGADWAEGELKRVMPSSRLSQPVAIAGLLPAWSATSEQLPVVHAGWLGGDPILYGRSSGRVDWYRLGRTGPVNLTSSLQAVSSRLVMIASETAVLIADGRVWKVEGEAQAVALSSGGQALIEVPGATGLSGLRPQFNDTSRRPGVVVRTKDGDLFRAGPEGLELMASAGNASVRAPGSIGLLETSQTPEGAETLAWISRHKRRDLTTINRQLAMTERAEVIPIEHAGPDGQPLTSWLYAPRMPLPSRPPLVVIPYPGLVHARQPDLGGPSAVMTAYNVQVLVGAGYAVLLPSLPRNADEDASLGLGLQIEAAIDAASETDRFDRDRIALWGHSFGSFGAVTAVTQSDRFDGVIASNGPYDQASKWGTFTPFQRLSPSDLLSINSGAGGVETGQASMANPPWRDPDRYHRNSPIFAADRIKVPVLLITSDLDYVPLNQSEMLFSALYRQGKDALLITYVGEGHVVSSPGNLRHMYGEVLAWLARLFPSAEAQAIEDASSQRRAHASTMASSMMSP